MFVHCDTRSPCLKGANSNKTYPSEFTARYSKRHTRKLLRNGDNMSRLKLHPLTKLLNLDSYIGKNRTKCIARSLYTWSRCKGLLQTNHDVIVYQKRFKIPPHQSTISIYDPAKPTPPHGGTLLEELSDGLEIVKRDIPVFKQQIIDKWSIQADVDFQHGDFEYFEQFDSQAKVDKWVVSADSDTDQGKSLASLKHTDKNTAVFHGNICQEVPKDGFTERAGYCAIRSPYNLKAFEKTIPYDWTLYSHVCLSVRGDGRNYMLLMHMERNFDVNALDMYAYPLYTRGGPYWQFVKIPFSHFLLTFKGRAQVRQEMMNTSLVKSFTIAAGDFEGPFRLEIDYIALVYDGTTDRLQDFKYELYKKENYIT